MATIKQLIELNKKAFDSGFYIESCNLSLILINKALKQVITDDFKQEVINQKIKTNLLIKHIKTEINSGGVFKTKVSKKTIKELELFLSLHKSINKELKFQYPEKKIFDTAKHGISCIVILNTSLQKIKNNKSE